jgi:hypothetical protein
MEQRRQRGNALCLRGERRSKNTYPLSSNANRWWLLAVAGAAPATGRKATSGLTAPSGRSGGGLVAGEERTAGPGEPRRGAATASLLPLLSLVSPCAASGRAILPEFLCPTGLPISGSLSPVRCKKKRRPQRRLLGDLRPGSRTQPRSSIQRWRSSNRRRSSSIRRQCRSIRRLRRSIWRWRNSNRGAGLLLLP